MEHRPFEVAFLSGGHPTLHAVYNSFQILFAKFAKQALKSPFCAHAWATTSPLGLTKIPILCPVLDATFGR